MTRVKRFLLIIVALGAVLGLSEIWGEGQVRPHLRPVITEGRRDGLLLGFDFGLALGDWSLDVGGAYGLVSRMARFRTGVGYAEAVALSYGDWPKSWVLGREGERGLHLRVDLIALDRLLSGEAGGLLGEILKQSRLQGTGFIGDLWPGEGEQEGPAVRYLHLGGVIHWPLPLGIALETRGEFLFGQTLPGAEHSFQTAFSSTKLQAGEATLELKMGELENPANLLGFRFNLGLRSYAGTFEGDRFFLISLERRFEALSAHLFYLDLRGLLGPRLGWIPIDLHLSSAIFFEGGIVFGRGDRPDEVLFGWGTSFIFPDLELRVDLAVNREGVPRLTVQTGILP